MYFCSNQRLNTFYKTLFIMTFFLMTLSLQQFSHRNISIINKKYGFLVYNIKLLTMVKFIFKYSQVKFILQI